MRIYLQKVLNAITMIRVSCSHLLEHRAYPYGANTKALQVTYFVDQPLQVSACKAVSCLTPVFCIHCILDGVAIIRRRKKGSGAVCGKPCLLVIRKAIKQ